MSNLITYGLDNVHIAFKGVSQTETIKVTNKCETDGEITVTITATTLLGDSSPKSVVVPLASESHDTATKVASAIVNVLNNDSTINTVFRASAIGDTIYLIAKIAQTNDASLTIAVTPGDTGVTVGSSTAVAEGTAGWGTPVAIPGAVRFTPSVEGSESKFYADNKLYFSIIANNGYTAELEAALIPDEILVEMLGWIIDDNRTVIELTDAIPKRFALMGQVRGDSKNRRFVYYDCQASRPEKEEKTVEDAIEPGTQVLNLTIFPINLNINGQETSVVKGTMELSASNVAAFNSFFDSVYVPVVS